ncbi:MAG: peptide ABC transporter substrate-binding protein [Methylobacter sp.]|nr:MAG: peptide ABC transporter substrate-binding protein [Methylobacter sp.]
MSREIKESDWKLLRQLHKVALERFCQRVLNEIECINSDSTKSFHQRYLDIFNVIERRDKEIVQYFNDVRRSTALTQLALMQASGLITEEEFMSFSSETRSVLEVLTGNRSS